MPFTTGLSGLKSANSDLRITGNNIANTSTTGFKESRAEFSDVYAASVLGTGGNAIGTGVRLARVAQQFTQGTVTFTDNNLDLAINGQGFFSLDAGGERLYSRAGAFAVDNTGAIVNSDGANLRGFLPDFSTNPEGEISGAIGSLTLDTANIPPVATTEVSTSLNLDSGAEAPAAPFATGFTPSTPPGINTYNNSSSVTVYDSLGVSHIMTLYFVKDDLEDNKWQIFTGIDGTDVTPTPEASQPNPFTLIFDNTGQFVFNDPTVPPVINQAAEVVSSEGSFINAGGLSSLSLGEMTINGITIPAAVADGVSSTDDTASAKAIAEAIVGGGAGTVTAVNTAVASTITGLTGISATVQPATVSLGNFTPPTTPSAFSAGDLVINGVDIIGTNLAGDPISNVSDMVDAINYHLDANAPDIPIVATNPTGDEIVLTVANVGTVTADGRNIQVDTDGTVPGSATFSGFNLSSPTSRVQRGTVTLSQTGAESITIAGTQPLDGGFTPGTTFASVTQTNSDVVTISDYDAGNGSATQTLTLSFDDSTQFGADFAVQSLLQNGSSTGRLAGVDADSTGILFARFTNGRSRKLGQILLANFANPQGLQPQGNTNWSETFSSGAALEGAPQSSNLGAIQSGGLEDSNVKLTEELVDLIIAQRNFQANAQTIRTADTVQQTIINIR